jgi:hypothetical protein
LEKARAGDEAARADEAGIADAAAAEVAHSNGPMEASAGAAEDSALSVVASGPERAKFRAKKSLWVSTLALGLQKDGDGSEWAAEALVADEDRDAARATAEAAAANEGDDDGSGVVGTLREVRIPKISALSSFFVGSLPSSGIFKAALRPLVLLRRLVFTSGSTVSASLRRCCTRPNGRNS